MDTTANRGTRAGKAAGGKSDGSDRAGGGDARPGNGAADAWASAFAFGGGGFERLAETQRHALEQFSEFQRAAFERMRRLQEIELEFGSRLMGCSSPSAAVTVMSEWAAARVEAIVEGQQEMQRLVLDAVSEATDDAQGMKG
jgi:hypothetical protein